ARSSIRAAPAFLVSPRLRPCPFLSSILVLVRRKRLELLCLAAPAPKAGASTNSATLAAATLRCGNTRKNNVLYSGVPVGHYENFPVASLLLPKALRAPIEVIYRFARGADDIADEGDDPTEIRLQKLQRYRDE